jgi:hypothetical protein
MDIFEQTKVLTFKSRTKAFHLYSHDMFEIFPNNKMGRAMAQAVSCRPLIAKGRTSAPITPCGIWGG